MSEWVGVLIDSEEGQERVGREGEFNSTCVKAALRGVQPIAIKGALTMCELSTL